MRARFGTAALVALAAAACGDRGVESSPVRTSRQALSPVQVSGELPGLPAVIGNNPRQTNDFAVGFDGTTYRLSWIDSRDTELASFDLWTMRVGVDGGLLDPWGVFLSHDFLYSLRVACNAGSCLNAMGEYVSLYGLRESGGAPVDAVATPFFRSAGSFPQYAVAAAPGGFLLTWDDPQSPSGQGPIWAQHLPASGPMTDGGFLVFAGPAQDVVAAWDGTQNWIAWDDGGVPTVAMLASDGGVALRFDVVTAPPSVPAAFASGPGGALLTLENDSGFVGIFVESDGGRLALPIGVAAPSGRMASAYAGPGYWVLWNGNGVLGARLVADGGTLDPAGRSLLAAPATVDSIACDSDGGCLVAYRPTAGGNRAAALLDWGTATMGPALQIPASQSAPANAQPSLACLPDQCLAIWYESSRAVAGRFFPDGGWIDAAPILVTNNISNNANPISVAAGAGMYLVVWTSYASTNTEIRAARISAASGAVLDPLSLLLTGTGSTINAWAASFDGNEFLVAGDAKRGGLRSTLFEVSLDGGVGVIEGCPACPLAAINTTAAGTPEGRVAAWRQLLGDGGTQFYAGRFQPDGGALDPQGLPLWPGHDLLVGFRPPVVVVSDGGFDVYWLFSGFGPTPTLVGARISLDAGIVVPAAPIVSFDVPVYGDATFAPSGAGALMIWGSRDAGDVDLWGAHVTVQADAGFIDGPFPVSQLPFFEENPSLALLGGGSYALAYTRFLQAPEWSPRLHLRFLSEPVPDAGAPDAGAVDAGSFDAGGADAGAPDAGVTDAGLNDAGALDAGSTRTLDARCGCGTDSALILFLSPIVLLRSRRRR